MWFIENTDAVIVMIMISIMMATEVLIGACSISFYIRHIYEVENRGRLQHLKLNVLEKKWILEAQHGIR